MEWDIYPHEDGSGDWVVQAINFENDGEIDTTVFSGSNTKRRAQEYHQWMSRSKKMAAAQS